MAKRVLIVESREGSACVTVFLRERLGRRERITTGGEEKKKVRTIDLREERKKTKGETEGGVFTSQ